MHQDLAAGASSCSRGLLAGDPRRHSTTVFAARLTQPGGGCTLGQWASPVGVNRTTLRPVVDVEFLLPVHFPIHEPLTGNPTSELRGTRCDGNRSDVTPYEGRRVIFVPPVVDMANRATLAAHCKVCRPVECGISDRVSSL